jgi:hypothetical protein
MRRVAEITWQALIRATPLIRRGGFLPGAAALLARGGVGATTRTISPPYNPNHPAQSFPEKSGLGAADSGKSPARIMKIKKRSISQLKNPKKI